MTQRKWEELEKIVAEIQKQLAPNALVEHNKKKIGRSGIKRKLDVAISTHVGSIPIFIIFDCKHHNKPVTLKDVAAFSVQVEDVNANLGVMVSSSGYDAGAKAIARQKNILIQTYRKAEENDWDSLVGDKAWISIIGLDLVEPMALAILSSHPNQFVNIPLNSFLFDEHGKQYSTILEEFWASWKANGEKLGDTLAEASFSKTPPAFIQTADSKTIQIFGIKIIAKVIAKQYVVNMNFAKGDVIEDDAAIKYRSLETEFVDWRQSVNAQIGVELNADDYEMMKKEPNALVFSLPKDKKYMRVTFKQMRKE